MGVLSLYKVFRNNTGQKKEREGKRGKGRKRAERKKGRGEKRREGGKGERRKGIYWRKRRQEKTDKGSEGLFLL